MKTVRTATFLVAGILAAGSACFAQQWELGGGGGAGFLPGVGLNSSLGAATAGFQSGVAAGAFVSQNLNAHISGEVRYEFQQSNLSLKSGGTQASFSGMAHMFHYDVLWHTNRKGSRSQYFIAFGGGAKLFSGTGTEEAYQPLSQFGYFTKTHAFKPMVSVGAGMKFVLRPRVILRTEFRDFITMFPKELITPAPGAKVGTLLHDFVPMVEISYVY